MLHSQFYTKPSGFGLSVQRSPTRCKLRRGYQFSVGFVLLARATIRHFILARSSIPALKKNVTSMSNSVYYTFGTGGNVIVGTVLTNYTLQNTK